VRRGIALVAVVAVVAALAAACGQRSGVHTAFVTQYRQPVAVSTTAHGQSSKTRRSPTRARIRIRPERVPGGRRILVVRTRIIKTDTGTPIVTWPQWGSLLLDRLGAPRCANNLIVVVAWAAQEGTQAGWNPLATTYSMPDATLFNSAGVRNYSSLAEGLAATIRTLQLGYTLHGYGAIVRDLRACADPLVTASAINASDWCHGCAGGAYVLGVVPKVIAAYVSTLQSSR
jgi:hypothetical protein